MEDIQKAVLDKLEAISKEKAQNNINKILFDVVLDLEKRVKALEKVNHL